MSEMLKTRKLFGPYELEVWSDGIRVRLTEDADAVDPALAARALRSMANWLEFTQVEISK